ncbi:retinoic acid-induced protein 1 [Electrophorus electricus]|uniref:retinoic acid-induced protein 1 n=1 Tax=Electrophorus electricus TaxID=8005 RepID=UPI0015D06D67|nr:retinoic acid-induced protein 1 [Electrophorus electricus]XP_026889048.2 retinoic acid-induced protein 1 [Electrophorus electricus]
MQSFRERSGFHGNQHCYQQEPHELSRLESYRHHHGQAGQGYEAHSLAAAGMPVAAGSKDCYGQQTYPSYSGGSAQTKKPYRGGKAQSQHLQAGYSGHVSSGYSAQYVSEGHLQQKWEEPAQMAQYEQDMVGRLEPGISGSTQYLEQNLLTISQSQCHLPSAPVYTSAHQQGHPSNPTPSPLMYPQSHLHFPQHSQPASSTSSSYMEKCNPIPHGYKSGYGMPPNAQYSRQLGNHSSLKQSGYRPQNNYGYQQPPSRTGFEQQAPLQGIPNTPESLQKFQHYNQPQQNYCISDISVRSPEQYYQNCSPSSSHSPARSVGRSPSYSSTPSPLMPNPDTFQYGQAINPAVSSSSAALQDQSMLMPPHTHPSPSVNHQSQSYSSSMKDRFSEKLLSNPSLWSLNALTSQVENISNNVQQLLLSEALLANKKCSKRNQPKKGEDYRGQVRAMEDSSCPDSQHGPLPTDPYGTARGMPADLQEGGYSSSTEDQMERSYYYFGQGKGPTQASAHSQLTLDTVSTCSMNSTDDMSIRSGDSVRSLQSAVSEDNLSCDPRVQRVPFGEEQNSSLRSITDEKSPISVTVPSPMKQESNSPLDIKRSESSLRENFEKSAWTERMANEKETGKRKFSPEHEFKGGIIEVAEKQQEWSEDKKCPSLFHKINKVVSEESYDYEIEDTVYQDLKNKYEAEERDLEKDCGLLDMSLKGNGDSEIKSEMFKSESQPTVESPVTTSLAISRDIFESNKYLPRKEENSDAPHLISQSESSEERLLVSERLDSFEEQQSVSSHPATELREKRCLSLIEEVINNKAKPEEPHAEACNNAGEVGGARLGSTETVETAVHDTAHRSSERRSAICDTAPQSHSVKNGFSALNEKTTPQTQARDHIDRSDAKVLEPDSPQLPGKSILHSAPSWADTPPSPQKGDGDIEPGISCPSAVTPSAKPEPLSPSALPRLLGRKHARGRRRLIHSNGGIRRQMSVEGDGAPPSPQKPSIPSSNSALFPDHMGTAQLDISSQTTKFLTDGCLPSRMCTRSFGSQTGPKVCSQERRKPGPKPSSKPGPKPGPKLGLKPGPKPGLKSAPKPGLKPGTKPGQKPSPKPGPKPGLKSGPRPGSKPGTKPGPKPGAVPSVKLGPKSGPKPAAIPALKPSPKPGSKPTEGGIPKGPGRPRGFASKIKPMKHEDNVQAITEHIKDTGSINESTEQQENTAVTLDTVVSTNVDSTAGSTLETALDTTSVKSVAKEQKTMVLRSRKQTQRKFTEDIEKGRMTSAEALAMKLTETPIQEVAQPCENQTSDLKPSNREDSCTDSLSQPNEEIVSVSIKRKSSLHSPDPVKKKKNVKVSLTTTQKPPLQTTLVGARASRGRRKRGHKLEPSICSILAKDNPPPEDISDTPCVPPQCPTKTKYLPPRKGRGLKYEALVQKITSPASKKQLLTVQPDVPEQATLKPAPEPQVTEHREIGITPKVAIEEGESAVSIEESPDTAFIQTPRKKRKKWATMEKAETPDMAPATGSLIINTPRLAKQRAIKNNHEMHLKQRKRRKGSELVESEPLVEEQEQIQTSVVMPPAELPPSPPAGSSPFLENERPPAEISSTITKPKRGRRPSFKKKQEEGQPMDKDESLKVKKKPGPKKKIQQNSNVIKLIVKGLKTKSRKERIPTVKGKLSDFLTTQSESKCSFRPYVRIDSSRELASHCTIVNRPEEEQLLIQSSKTSLVKVKNLVTVTKAIPHSSVMLQGPLVNKRQTDRCVLCCLCRKPANYRELGDLCGPYYSEDSIPRKTLSSVYQDDFRQSRDREKCKMGDCSAESSDVLKGEGGKNLLQEGTYEGDFGQLKRERRTQLRSRLGLRIRCKRLQLLHRGAGGAAPSAGEEVCDFALQRLQLEAETKEHWAHEACTIWTNGVILVASKLYGLREAAQHSTVTKCSKCQIEGASIECSWSNCTHKYHYVCAKETGCTFEEDTFLIKCPKHKPM